MKDNKIVLSLLILILTSGCAEMSAKKPAEYIPEIKKEISFTFDSATTKDSKDGLNLIFTKADLMDEIYKVNECGAQPVADKEQPTQAATPAKGSPQPSLGGLLGGLGALAQATTSPAKPSNNVMTGATTGDTSKYKVIERKFLPDNAVVFKVDIKSEINHVLGFEKSYFLLRDPQGNIHKAKPIVADANWGYINWCATKEQASTYYDRMNSVRDFQSALVFPKDSYTAYVAFYPQTKDIPGDWKLLMYELPVATNNAGSPISTDHFYSKGIVKKWETTFKKMTPTGAFEKVETKEVL